jgi:hypothetical protein
VVTGPSGAGLRLVVATSPADFENGHFLAHDLQMVRSALLYADTVELLSPAAVMVGSVAALESADGDAWLSVFDSMDDSSLASLGVDGDPAQWKATLAEYRQISALPRAERRRALGAHNAELQRLKKEMERYIRGADGPADMLREILETAGAPELVEAVESGALTLSWDFMSLDADTDTQIEQYAERLRLLLASPNEHLLLDERMAGIAREMIEEGQVTPHDLVLSRAARSQLGTGLVSRLPAFPNASVSSVLQARGELADALSAYRRGVARISEKVRSGPFDEGMHSEVTDVWRDEVQPAVNRLRADLSRTRLSREAAVNLGTDAKTALSAAFMLSAWRRSPRSTRSLPPLPRASQCSGRRSRRRTGTQRNVVSPRAGTSSSTCWHSTTGCDSVLAPGRVLQETHRYSGKATVKIS